LDSIDYHFSNAKLSSKESCPLCGSDYKRYYTSEDGIEKTCCNICGYSTTKIKGLVKAKRQSSNNLDIRAYIGPKKEEFLLSFHVSGIRNKTLEFRAKDKFSVEVFYIDLSKYSPEMGEANIIELYLEVKHAISALNYELYHLDYDVSYSINKSILDRDTDFSLSCDTSYENYNSFLMSGEGILAEADNIFNLRITHKGKQLEEYVHNPKEMAEIINSEELAANLPKTRAIFENFEPARNKIKQIRYFIENAPPHLVSAIESVIEKEGIYYEKLRVKQLSSSFIINETIRKKTNGLSFNSDSIEGFIKF
jgi:Zn ribbon nucleic-acid-binding protein